MNRPDFLSRLQYLPLRQHTFRQRPAGLPVGQPTRWARFWVYFDALDHERVSPVFTYRYFPDEEVIDKNAPGEVFENPTCGQ